jgi:hypothetical protein
MRYIQGIERYNDACNVALDYAISTKDKDFAQKIVTLFKRTLDVFVSNDKWFTKEDEYYYQYSDKPIEEAKRKLQKANTPDRPCQYNECQHDVFLKPF